MNFTEAKSLTIPEGNVTKITNAAGNILWSAAVEIVSYFTFSSPETFSISVETPGWDGTMYYSTDTANWYEWGGSAVSGTKIYLAGSGNTKVTGTLDTSYAWTLTGSNIACSGNIETLLDWETVAAGEHPSMAYACYHCMFYNCTGLTTAPELPATTLAEVCYAHMFYGCTGLTAAPALLATTLEYRCYAEMFWGCTSLTQAPALPATSLAQECYYYMFYGCTGIKLSETQTGNYTKAYRIPTSGTGTTATNALNNMFSYTGGTFTGTPEINTTYYLDSSCTIV